MNETIAYHRAGGNVVAFFPEQAEPIKSADSNHPYWTDIIRKLENNDPSAYELFDVRKGIGAKLRSLSERIDYDGKDVFFDGTVVDDALAQQVTRFLEQGVSDWEPLVKFWEKIAQNPSDHSRDNLYRWLRAHEFSITSDGDIVGYKAVKVNTGLDGNNEFRSIHAGPAIVDGVSVNGNVPNQPGSVVTMERAKVTADPSVGCHVGLHVGTWDYAQQFGNWNGGHVTLEVHVNPRDVVSVPTECADAKMRVSKYVVVQQIGAAYAGAVLTPEEDYDDDWDDVGYRF